MMQFFFFCTFFVFLSFLSAPAYSKVNCSVEYNGQKIMSFDGVNRNYEYRCQQGGGNVLLYKGGKASPLPDFYTYKCKQNGKNVEVDFDKSDASFERKKVGLESIYRIGDLSTYLGRSAKGLTDCDLSQVRFDGKVEFYRPRGGKLVSVTLPSPKGPNNALGGNHCSWQGEPKMVGEITDYGPPPTCVGKVICNDMEVEHKAEEDFSALDYLDSYLKSTNNKAKDKGHVPKCGIAGQSKSSKCISFDFPASIDVACAADMVGKSLPPAYECPYAGKCLRSNDKKFLEQRPSLESDQFRGAPKGTEKKGTFQRN